MVQPKTQTHRPGAFKQSNKEHKHGRHRSKGSLSNTNKGKVSVKVASKRNKRDLNRDQRRHQSAQLRQKKRDEVIAKKRLIGSLDYAPFLIAVVPLNREFDPTSALAILTQCDEEAVVRKSGTGVTHICIPKFKKRFSFVVPANDNEFDLLDTLKVADTVLFLLSSVNASDDIEQIVDQWGNKMLMSSNAQGMPTPVVALTDLDSVAPKRKQEFKQAVQKIVSQWLPEEKVMPLDKSSDAINILRKIGDQKRKHILYRDRRPYLYGEEVEYVVDTEGTMGTLKISGYLKGMNLSVNQLVHLPGLGDFQLSQIDISTDPNKVDKSKGGNSMDVQSEGVTRVFATCDPAQQESLDSENIPDPMDAEQTWPNEDDYEMAEKESEVKKERKVPKGWSDYQAAWIPDDDADFQDSDSEEDDNDDQDMLKPMDVKSDYSDNEEKDFDTVTESDAPVNDDKYDQDLDLNAEKEDLEKMKEAKSDFMFPDEMDTPVNVPASERFQKYRGLESFKTSPWDPKENLPSDYARIFQFQNFSRLKKKILQAEEEKEGAPAGWYITVHVKNVSQLMWSTFEKTKSPVTLVGLFPHEHKMSVLNVALKRIGNYGQAIKSKERLIFQCGFRRFMVNPIFSQHTLEAKHKFERFFQPDSTVVATFYAPIQFPPAPVLCYKEVLGTPILVANGTLLSVDPNRLVIKRIVLSGHPFKIFKKSAVIRFMFFNREDIMYYKPIELRTKMGRKGNIKEPLGTHGHMKCIFNGQLKSQDTVLLNLYKRVFPKWTFENLVVSCVSNDVMETQ